MIRFTALDDVAVVLVSRGLYRQAKAYQRDGYLYAGYGGGFLRLLDGGGTSKPDIRWDGHEIENAVRGQFGWLRLK